MAKKKIIGIPGYVSDTNFGAGKTHLEYISQFGNPRIIMPHEELVKVDLLYLPGGADMNPANYGEYPSFYTQGQDVFKEYFFRERLKNYVKEDIPIFGVCLGFQSIAVHFGAKLTQHLLYHPSSPGRREEGHKVKTMDAQGKVMDTFPVNSHHHQGLLMSQVPDCFNIIAVEDYKKDEKDCDHVVEALMHKDKLIGGVQWHPEEWYDSFSDRMIRAFLKEL